ncbi:MAG: leucine-rich repeat domain-containing protein [Clostridiales bacterium]|nr:MAG: leucine-rich repeat domain-containing protein [Clostridiales bacterium]
MTRISGEAFLDTAWYNNQLDGLVYAGKVAYKYKGTMPNNTSIVLKEGTLGIAGSAFSGCTGLTSITIPDSVTSIGGSAFSGCTGLTSVTIPDSVTSIGDHAFASCTGLTSIIVEEGNTKYHSAGNCLIETATKTLILGCNTSVIPTDGSVTSIGGSAFSGCTGLTSITIPDSVTSIGNSAFYDCSGLTSVTIPDSVTHIDDYAFNYCTSLTTINFNGTMEQWNAILKGTKWKTNVPATQVVCTDGKVSI